MIGTKNVYAPGSFPFVVDPIRLLTLTYIAAKDTFP